MSYLMMSRSCLLLLRPIFETTCQEIVALLPMLFLDRCWHGLDELLGILARLQSVSKPSRNRQLSFCQFEVNNSGRIAGNQQDTSINDNISSRFDFHRVKIIQCYRSERRAMVLNQKGWKLSH